MNHMRNVKSGMVHDRGAAAEHRYDKCFEGIADMPSVIRLCRDTYNAINDPAFELTNDPVTCKTCKKMPVQVIVEFNLTQPSY
jgi:hypothetical protein